MFDINWTTFVAWLWPPEIRTSFWVQWCRVLIAPVVTVYNWFMTYRSDNIYKLAHTSQVWSIEKVLNDHYDQIERRIYLQDAGGKRVLFLQRRSDEDPVMIGSRASTTDPPLIHTRSAYDGGTFDFVVVLPYSYPLSDHYAIRAWVNYYKLAGKRFDIIPPPTT